MTKTSIKYLNNLKSDILDILITDHFFNTSVNSPIYINTVDQWKKDLEKIIHIYEKGYITKTETSKELINYYLENKTA